MCILYALNVVLECMFEIDSYRLLSIILYGFGPFRIVAFFIESIDYIVLSPVRNALLYGSVLSNITMFSLQLQDS